MTKYIEAYKALGLSLTPGGIWKMERSSEYAPSKKIAIDAKRVDYLSWQNYPDDNMGRVYLQEEYLVIDVDGSFLRADAEHIYLSSGITLPLTWYTTTTAENKIHAYYQYPEGIKLPHRTKSIVEQNIDTFCYGTVFGGHLKLAQIHEHPIAELPLSHPFMQTLLNMPHSINSHSSEIIPVSKPGVYRAFKEFMHKEFLDRTQGQQTKVIKQLLPRAYHPKKGTRPNILKEGASYSLINDMAAKLSTVAEISTTQLREFLIKYVTATGQDPYYKNQLDSMILATLPSREAIQPQDPDEGKTLDQMMDEQRYTLTPTFKTSIIGERKAKLAYIQVDKLTQEVIIFNKSVYADKDSIVDRAPERQIKDEDGIIINWDSNVPLVELVNDPYEPPIQYDRYPIINLYRPTEYIKQVDIRRCSTDNLLLKTVASVIHPDYLHIMLTWMAYTVFHDSPPIVVPFIATDSNTPGGTGKSAVTISILAHILGSAAAAISFKDLKDGWADTIVGKRLISLEDLEQLNRQQTEELDALIKRLFTTANKTLNYKGGAVISEQFRSALSATSNHIPALSISHRRLMALEPAHISGDTEPLTQDEIIQLDSLMMAQSEYNQEIQEFTNHLRYIYSLPLTNEMHGYLFNTAVNTKYRESWIGESRNYSARVYLLMGKPQELLALTRTEADEMEELIPLATLFQYVIAAYNGRTQKSALSWEWYRELLGHIQGTEVLSRSKASIEQALDCKFTSNTGFGSNAYPREAADQIIPNYVISGPPPPHISTEAITEYQEIVQSLL